MYVDDCLTYGRTPENVFANWLKLLTRLAAKRVKLKLKKLQLFREVVNVLGFEVSGLSIRPLRKSLQAIHEIPTPSTKEEVRSFCGVVTILSFICEGAGCCNETFV